MDFTDIKIIGPNKNKIRFSENVPVISFQLSMHPNQTWVKIYDRVCRSNVHSKKPRATVTGDYIEFLYAGQNSELQFVLDLICKDINETNTEYKNILLAQEQQELDQRRKKEMMEQDIRNTLDGLKYN